MDFRGPTSKGREDRGREGMGEREGRDEGTGRGPQFQKNDPPPFHQMAGQIIPDSGQASAAKPAIACSGACFKPNSTIQTSH